MDEPIRVLCVFSWLDRGGAESMCMDLYRYIDRSKVQFDFVKHTSRKCSFEDEITELGGRIFEAPRYMIYNHFLYKKWWDIFLSSHPEYHIVHGHFFTISAVFFKVAKKYSVVTIGHSHCTPSNEKGIKHFLSNVLVSQIAKQSDYCFACSKEAGKWIFKSKPFTVLNNAIDVQKFRYSVEIRDDVRKEFGFGNELVLGTVGRIVQQKNPHGVIDIFAAIHRIKPHTKMLWVGENFMKDEVDAHIHRLGIEDAVLFTGVRNDVNRILQAMDIFILPSFYEGFSISTLEAQASGLQCFVSDNIPREVGLTDLCHFLPYDDSEKWAKEICTSDFSHRKDTSEQIINAGYDIHTTAKWLQNFYLSIGQGGQK